MSIGCTSYIDSPHLYLPSHLFIVVSRLTFHLLPSRPITPPSISPPSTHRSAVRPCNHLHCQRYVFTLVLFDIPHDLFVPSGAVDDTDEGEPVAGRPERGDPLHARVDRHQPGADLPRPRQRQPQQLPADRHQRQGAEGHREEQQRELQQVGGDDHAEQQMMTSGGREVRVTSPTSQSPGAVRSADDAATAPVRPGRAVTTRVNEQTSCGAVQCGDLWCCRCAVSTRDVLYMCTRQY